jgi:hypothetical protein
MILISHRGNIDGKNEVRENSPFYIMESLSMGFDVEIDIWFVDNKLFLGHDEPQYEITFDWINEKSNKLWVHCKNIESFQYFNLFQKNINYFWHQEDTLTFTSKGYVWVFPGKQPIKNSISVLPEIFNDDISKCIGVCSDYIKNYKLC